LLVQAKLNEMNESYKKMEEEFARSCKIRDRLESLSKELQKQTDEIKVEIYNSQLLQKHFYESFV